MPSTTTLQLPRLLEMLYPMLHRISKQEEGRWALLFKSYVADQDLSQCNISRYTTGKRRIPYGYVLWYADWKQPRCPNRLFDDLQYAVDMICNTTLDRRHLWTLLVSYIEHYVDPLDQPDLLPKLTPSIPSNDDVTMFWCRVLWYTICHDTATR